MARKSNRKSTRKSNRKSTRKSNRKSTRKSNRKSTRKSNRKSTQKNNRKSRKSNCKSTRKSNCKSGYITRRKGYTTKSGKKVPPKCVKVSKLTKTQKKLYTTPNKKYIQKPKGNKKCPPGKIVRSSYTVKRKSGKSYKVPAKCVTDTGKRGRGPNVIKIKPKKGVMKQFGYSTKKSAIERHKAIKKFIKAMNYDYNYVIRSINLIANYNKPIKTSPRNDAQKIRQAKKRKTHKILISDLKFAQELKKKGWKE